VSLWRYILRRLLLAVPQMFLISVVTFVLIRMLPGDPARLQLGPLASEEGVQRLREQMHLDGTLPEQYIAYLQRLARGDLGRSWNNSTEVANDLVSRLPATLELITFGLLVIVLVLVPIGAITAARGGGLVRRALKRVTFGYGLLSGALPDFWLGLLFIFIFFTTLGWAPGPVGRLSIGMAPPPRTTGFYTIDSLLAGQFDTFLDAVAHLALPVLTLSLVYGGAILKTTRLTVGRALRSDYTTYEEGLGLPHRQVLMLALRNSAPSIIVMTGIVVGFLLGGAVLIETVYNLNGIGQYAVQAIASADYAPIQAFVLVAALFTMLVYLVVDLLYFAVDPRVRGRVSRPGQ
jgi:ABC-type dipeptide/oligopeptide/nickel transport system permease component